jgi:hypothetical protein
MIKLATAVLVILSLAGWAFGQSYRDALAKAREVKLLESTRDDIRRLFAGYNTSEGNDHFARYYNDDVSIRVKFSDGTCSEDPEENDDSVVWKVSEWTVTHIEIDLEEAVALKDAGFDLSKFVKEQMYRDTPDAYMHHDKARGAAIETRKDGVMTVIFFPPSSASKRLCEGNTSVKDFYTRKSWFAEKLEERVFCDFSNGYARVDDLVLSATSIEASSNRKVSVTTRAVDPENDVLTYNYTVSGGRIIGTGAKVVWDFSGVAAGTYSITVGVDDGAGIIGRTITKTVIVR